MVKDRASAAIALRHAVIEAAKLVGEQPEIGTERPEVVDPPLRVWPLHRFNYVIVYDPVSRPIQILRIVHGARDLPQILHNLRAD
jgi:toxin ParE1/3/4